MEFVPFSDTTLWFLALDDPCLKRVFRGVVPADRLPQNPSRTTQAAYIVNTVPEGDTRRHWLAIWSENNVWEVLDSYGLPLTTYHVRSPRHIGMVGPLASFTEERTGLASFEHCRLWPLCVDVFERPGSR